MKYIVKEYGKGITLSELQNTGLTEAELYACIEKANERISSELKISRRCLQIVDGRLRALGVAGVIGISTGFELEIVPKFIPYQGNDEWQSTLYMLATLSKYGNILINERIHSSTSYVNSLYDIAGRILAQEYSQNSRRIIRKYNRRIFYDYSIEGDIDFEVEFERNADGIEQTQVRFNRLNAYNATIKAAMGFVKPYVSDNGTRNVLDKAISSFGIQENPSKHKVPISPRNRKWQLAYDLSFDILNGLGSSYHAGKIIAPGFIVDTWQLWEWLITSGLMLGYGGQRVISQGSVCWGYKESKNLQEKVRVIPDVQILQCKESDALLFVVDAKYKTLDTHDGKIDRADLYEAYAFCKATNTKEIFLTYPDDDSSKEAGSVTEVSSYHVDDITVHALMVEFGPINEKGGIYTFGNNLSREINEFCLTNSS